MSSNSEILILLSKNIEIFHTTEPFSRQISSN